MLRCFLHTALLLALASVTNLNGKDPQITHGVLDLRERTDPITSLRLEGEWEFYWKEFLPPGKSGNGRQRPDTYAVVPSYWTQYEDSIPGISGMGFGTYRLLVLFPEGYRDTLALKVPVFDSSFELFLNGNPAGRNGKTGKSAETSEPWYDPFLTEIILDHDSLEIMVHVSNFDHRRGGFWKTMILGQSELLQKKYDRNNLYTHALIGILFGTFLLFFFFFLFERRNLAFLYFSLTSLGILFRVMNTGSFPGNLFVDFSWEWLVRLEYLGTFFAYVFGILFLNSIFQGPVRKWLIRLNTLLFSILILLVILLPVRQFSYLIPALQGSLILFLSYFTINSFLGMLKKRFTDTVFFIALAFFLLATISDSLVSYSIDSPATEYITPLAFFFIIGSNTIIIIRQWVLDYHEKQTLHRELQHVNLNLEKIIENRTSELNQKNRQLENSLEFKNKLFSIIAHDLKSPITTLAQYTDLLLQDKDLQKTLNTATELRDMSYSLIDLVDNLLFWGMSQRKQIRYHAEHTDLHRLIMKTRELLKRNIEKKQIRIQFQVPGTFSAYCDPVLVSIILRNLLSNAIKFTPEGGEITLTGEDMHGEKAITIKDSGVGMDDEKIRELMHETQVSSSRGTAREKGTGLGFIVVKELVQLNRGSLHVKSKPGKGTEIRFTLPGNHEK